MKSKTLTQFIYVGFASRRASLIASTILVAACLLVASSQAQTPYEQDLDVRGVLGIGSWTGAPQIPGLLISYEDDNTTCSFGSTVHQWGKRWGFNWVWEHSTDLSDQGQSAPTVAMSLDPAHVLHLYNGWHQGNATINLDPRGVSSFDFGINIAGSPVLTQADGNLLYAGNANFRQGAQFGSTAIGYATTANGVGATAMGWGSEAQGDQSTAMGDHTTATNVGTAMGYYTNASNYIATAMGRNSVASGYVSTAMGEFTCAQSYDSVAIGRFNKIQGNPNDWVSDDDLFVIGNGSADNNRSNAFVVKKNGNTTISGGLAVKGDILIPQRGDLSMGEFTSGPQP